MGTIAKYVGALLIVLMAQNIYAQDEDYKSKIKILEEQKEKISTQEKAELKKGIQKINKQLENKEISTTEAQELKEALAKKHALNIENRIAILDNQIALLERNMGDGLSLNNRYDTRFIEVGWGQPDESDNLLLGIRYNNGKWKKRHRKYDRRTYSDLVLAIGLNNTLIDGQSLDDSPYRIGGSRFFELGYAWRTRIFKHTNFWRLNYGFSFQFNGLKPKGNQIFVANGDQTELQEFEFDLRKSKLRTDNLVFPVHLEIGPSVRREMKDRFRYSLKNQFRLGIGGYGGFNIGTRQKLKYTQNGENIKEKLKRDYNTADLIYGLSAYTGIGGALLYVKYDLNPLFKDAVVEQNNISVGLRFDY
ncbi:coiled-coil domain-containing protein [Spongiimicrobium salis]|uniref:coiled-coil domain-containing protein n=1 Tax=Spongiimicrobium salis TaxID=1667022 RepID=UPI00374DC5EC